MCSAKVADLKDERVPIALYWTLDDVCNWIKNEMKFPEYETCFRSNFVDGKKLITIDSSTLPNIGITDFEHIKVLSTAIRDLLTSADPYWNRSVSLPPREDIELYLEQKGRSGKTSQTTTYEKFTHKLEDKKWQPPLGNQGLILPK